MDRMRHHTSIMCHSGEKLARGFRCLYSLRVSVVQIQARGSTEIIDGRYELIEPLAEGGMGTVYRAIQHPIERFVAVKILRKQLVESGDERAIKRFYKEARAIASLHHPNIVSMYDFGETAAGDLYLVMELLVKVISVLI